MSFLKDLNEFHISLKSFIISIVFIMPFWYVDLFLFKRDFFTTSPFYVPIAFSFCLSVIWFIFHAFNSSVMIYINELIMKRNKKQEFAFLSVLASLFSICWLSLLTFIFYLTKLSFLSLILWGISITVFRALLWYMTMSFCSKIYLPKQANPVN